VSSYEIACASALAFQLFGVQVLGIARFGL
jgi:hypothetical protein